MRAAIQACGNNAHSQVGWAERLLEAQHHEDNEHAKPANHEMLGFVSFSPTTDTVS